MKCTAAPFLGSDVDDGFGEVPMVPITVLSVVLALAIRLVLRFSQDDGTILPRALAVTFSIFDADLNYVRIVGYDVAFGDREAAVAGLHLNAMISDAKTDSEPKSLGQPIGGCARVGVYQYRNDNAGRHGTVESHQETLSLTPSGNPA